MSINFPYEILNFFQKKEFILYGRVRNKMRLYMKQKIFSLTDKFIIKDYLGNDKYFVEGEFLSWGKKLHIYDANGHEVAFVKQRLITFLPKFEVYMDGNLVVEVVKEFTFFRPRYALKGTNWVIEGDFWQHDYQIYNGSQQIVTISKVWFSWGDSFELNVLSEADEVLAVATVLAIDCVLDSQSSSNHN